MGTIKKINKQTSNRFLNIYEIERENEHGPLNNYYLASRAQEIEQLKIKTKNKKPDGVIVYAICEGKVVLIKQYRYPLDDFIYEFPAGLVDAGEELVPAGVREFKEETGLEIEPIIVSNAYTKPYYMSCGMTDECCGTVFGYASGTVTDKYQEESEEIQVVLADREEAKRILREENVAIMCAYMLMHFINDDEPFAFMENIK